MTQGMKILEGMLRGHDSDEDYLVEYIETLDAKRVLITARDAATYDRKRVLVTVREVEQ